LGEFGGLVIAHAQFTKGLLGSAPTRLISAEFAYPRATLTISTDGTSGIVWVLYNSAYLGGTPDREVNTPGPAVLPAYRPDNLGDELYNSAQAGSRDTARVKFRTPTVANGHVCVGGAGALTVYEVIP